MKTNLIPIHYIHKFGDDVTTDVSSGYFYSDINLGMKPNHFIDNVKVSKKKYTDYIVNLDFSRLEDGVYSFFIVENELRFAQHMVSKTDYIKFIKVHYFNPRFNKKLKSL